MFAYKRCMQFLLKIVDIQFIKRCSRIRCNKLERNLRINVPERVPVRMLNVVIWKHLIFRRKVLMATLDRMTKAELCGRCRIPPRKSRERDECLPTDGTKSMRNKNVKIAFCSLRAMTICGTFVENRLVSGNNSKPIQRFDLGYLIRAWN